MRPGRTRSTNGCQPLRPTFRTSTPTSPTSTAAPADLPDIHPNIADVYRRKVERLAEALADPRDRDEAAEAIRGLIERIVLTPGAKRGEMDAALHGDLGTILEWAGNKSRKGAKDIHRDRMSVSVVAGVGFEPTTFTF